MEKLIELLNEYGEYQYYLEDGKLRIERADNYVIARFIELEIISKKFGFIKWLVDNDKIDFSRGGKYCLKSIEEFDGLLRDDEDGLIMLLAIQDEPIEFLISVLK